MCVCVFVCECVCACNMENRPVVSAYLEEFRAGDLCCLLIAPTDSKLSHFPNTVVKGTFAGGDLEIYYKQILKAIVPIQSRSENNENGSSLNPNFGSLNNNNISSSSSSSNSSSNSGGGRQGIPLLPGFNVSASLARPFGSRFEGSSSSSSGGGGGGKKGNRFDDIVEVSE